MFDEKRLKNLRKERESSQKSDYKEELDRKACAEGDAMRFFKGNDLRPQLGRRAAADNRGLNGARATMGSKAANNEARTDKKLRDKYIVPEPRQLRQGPPLPKNPKPK